MEGNSDKLYIKNNFDKTRNIDHNYDYLIV